MAKGCRLNHHANLPKAPNSAPIEASNTLKADLARDRWGLGRHRWEAANLKNDPNVTTRDVPVKFGDDATDALKHYLQTFALEAAPKTEAERLQEKLEAEFGDLARVSRPRPGEERRTYSEQEQMDIFSMQVWESRRKQQQQSDGRPWSADIIAPDLDDPWRW